MTFLKLNENKIVTLSVQMKCIDTLYNKKKHMFLTQDKNNKWFEIEVSEKDYNSIKIGYTYKGRWIPK